MFVVNKVVLLTPYKLKKELEADVVFSSRIAQFM